MHSPHTSVKVFGLACPPVRPLADQLVVADPSLVAVPVEPLGYTPVRWSPCEPGAVKLPAVGSLPLMEPPPLIMLPAVPQVPVVAVALLLAEVGPDTWVCLTVTVIPLTLIPLPLQIAKAVVWLPVPLLPPFNATAVHLSGLVSLLADAIPVLSEG